MNERKKFKIGQNVTTTYPGGPHGMIAKILLSEKGREYQFVFNNENGPTFSWMQPKELKLLSNNEIGFKKTKKMNDTNGNITKN